MSKRLEEMLRIAQAATPGPWEASAPDGSYHDIIRIYSGERANIPVAICPQQHSAALELLSGKTNETTAAACTARHIATFNPRTAEALVKVAMAAEKIAVDKVSNEDGWTDEYVVLWNTLHDELEALTAAMEDSNVG